tara:strand:+ start:198 stop:1232 length:1035 start_codon:yes stop_codon:yes gene_type:complete
MKFGLLFSQQVPPSTQLSWEAPYKDMLRCLPVAEKLGYDSAFQVSHHAQKDGLCPGPLIACSAASAVTEEMRIGTGVLLVPLYAPLKLAEDVAVLDNVSGGRFVFGVAPGYVASEFEAHQIPRDERVKRFEEALDLMTLAWTQEDFSFSGEYYNVPKTILTPKPMQNPHPPIWYGVSAPASLRRAARRNCVQIMSPRHGPEELKAHFLPYEEEAAKIGYKIPERPIIRSVFVAETKEKAEEIAAPALNYLFTELYGAASAAGDRVLRAADGSKIKDKDDVNFNAFKNRYIVGDPAFAIDQLKLYEKAVQPSEVICWMHLPGISYRDAANSMALFAKEVMPAFKA